MKCQISFEDSLTQLKDTAVSDFNAGVAAAPDKIINYVENIGKPQQGTQGPPNPANTGTNPFGFKGFFGTYFWWIVGGVALLAVLVIYGKKRRKL